MRLLVLGGGGFLGFHVVTHAVARGDEVTVFTRSGKTPVEGAEAVRGDRRGDLSGLRDQSWDAVIDTFTDTEPGAPAVAATADLLHDRVGIYGYVSGMSVYDPSGPDVPDESAPLRTAGAQSDRLQERSLAKLAAEQVVSDRFGSARALFPRVGIMVGPRSTRFAYWPTRFAGALDGTLPPTILLPGDLDRRVQFSDARDIASWVVAMLGDGTGGTYNAVGPGRVETLRTVLDACARAAGADGLDDLDTVIGGEDLLRRKLLGVDEEERPLWFPEDQIPQLAIDSTRALRAGLSFGPVETLAADTLRWAHAAAEPALTNGVYADLEPHLVGLVRDLWS